jgi:hypothetical protein
MGVHGCGEFITAKPGVKIWPLWVVKVCSAAAPAASEAVAADRRDALMMVIYPVAEESKNDMYVM